MRDLRVWHWRDPFCYVQIDGPNAEDWRNPKKKPQPKAGAKCLIFLVETGGIEPPTY